MASYSTSERKLRYIRPAWPYNDWKSDEISISDNPDDSLLKCSEDNEETDFTTEMYHDVDSEDDIDDSASISTLFNLLKSDNVSTSDEAKTINSMITLMIDKTIEKLSSSFKVFKKSYKMAIGSVTEGSKISKPDEFDFAIILPSLAEEDVYALLLREDSIQDNRDILDLLDDTQCENSLDFVLNFSKYLRLLWSNEMHRNLPANLEILETECYLDDVSVAGTFHLKRLPQNDVIDLDICFWIPLSAEKLSSAPEDIPQKNHLKSHCLDQHGLVYGILPRDEGIDYAINAVRFPMSSLEKQTFQQYGQENERIKCYRICKCIVQRLVPKYRKRENCDLCMESVISSFALKNTVLYLIDAYKADDLWSGGQLVNRVIEVFAILCMCQKMNCALSAFFSPYEIHFSSSRLFNPESCSLDEKPCEFYGQDKKPCILPNIEEIITKIDDPLSKKALSDYNTFIRQSSWRGPEVICRLYELLSNMRTTDEHEREQMVSDTGWSLYGIQLWGASDGMHIESVDTKL
ncbi:hypothetical protein ACF0H5_015160 [Mactra antiquata]